MRSSFFALMATLFLVGACSEPPQTSTPVRQATTPRPSTGSPTTPSGKVRIALLLPLTGQAAPIGQSLQQAAEMALFDAGAKELSLATYDSGSTPETAIEAYRKARTEGAALVLGPLFGNSATALAPLVGQGGANVVSFSNDEAAATRGVWVMGIAAPPQVRRVVDHAIDAGIKRFATFAPNTPYGEQMARTLESHVAVRGGTVVASELYDANSADLITPANYEEHLEFLSIKVQDGPLTSRLQHIQVGDKIIVGRKPTGTLLIDYLLPGKNLYLLSTGTGMAPFLSVIRDPETFERFEKVILVHGVREVKELAYHDYLTQELPQHEFLGEMVSKQFLYYPTVTREPFKNQGRLTDAIESGKLFTDLGLPAFDAGRDRVMICGSPQMLKDLKRMLEDRHFKEGNTTTPGDFVIERAFADQ